MLLRAPYYLEVLYRLRSSAQAAAQGSARVSLLPIGTAFPLHESELTHREAPEPARASRLEFAAAARRGHNLGEVRRRALERGAGFPACQSQGLRLKLARY